MPESEMAANQPNGAADQPGPRDGRARVVTLYERPPRSVELSDETIIGRSRQADIQVALPGISRHHARITRTADGFVIEDIGSRNGTFINGERIERRLLSFGDEIRLGEQVPLLFTRSDEIEPRLAAEQKMEAVGRLAAGVAHEFNNFLAIIVSSVEYLSSAIGEATHGRPDISESIEDALNAAQQASLVTRQLLSFARPSRNVVEDVDLSALLRDVAQLIRRTFDRSIAIQLQIQPGLTVTGERALLFQTFINLSLNARDAMPEGGKLTLRAQREATAGPASIVVEVEDTGIGIPEHALAHLFEPFYTTREGRGGTGLGLAIVYSAVRSHGGDVSVQSRAGMTRFTVRLPDSCGVHLKAGISPEERTQTLALSYVQPLRVLVVDDEPLVRNSVGRVIRGMGHDVMTASNGQEALDLYAKHGNQIGAVVLDLNMPLMGGASTFHALKEVNPDVKVVFLSGFAQDDRDELLRQGAAAVLDKPASTQQMSEALGAAWR